MPDSSTIPPWLRYLPISLRSRIEHRPSLLKVLSNIGWLFADKVLRMGVGLLVGVWVARYLGPEQFGLLNYAMAFVALFGAIGTLGLNGIVVRDLVKEPENANAILGTTFFLQALGGLLAFALAIIAVRFARPEDALAKLMVAVLGFVMVFKSTEVVKYWFESQVQSKYTVWVENGTFLLIAAVKVALILNEASLMIFVRVAFVEGAMVAVGLLVMYGWRGGRLGAWRVHYLLVKTLLNDSWPLILSGLAVMVYMRIDQIMIGQMLGDEAVGIYSAAVRISEVWYFIPIAVTASVFPSIIEAKKQSEALYRQRLQKLYDLMVILALIVAIPMMFLSDYVIGVLYGLAYVKSGTVLAISIWAGIFVFLGSACGNYARIENMTVYSLYQTVIGMVMNIILNILLIPVWGEIGAAIATVISYACATFAVLLFPRSRYNGLRMLKSMNLFSSSHLVWSFKRGVDVS